MNSVETEIMDIAQEECAEVIQAISKVRRFGFESVHNGKDNREHLEEEIGDLVCMFDLMREKGLIRWDNVIEASEKKREKLRTWSNIL
jgi:NTP pyrophosphatase (non-canonical NTP hydrolase)